ncbi:MAG: ABC transporter permease [Actinomycetota bacterium]
MSGAPVRIVPIPGSRRAFRLVERNLLVTRRAWWVFCSGFLEPVLFLGSIGIGVGGLVGAVMVAGTAVPYSVFVAPGLLATAAMNGAVLDATFGFFIKFKYQHVYDAVTATPMEPVDVARGEITWALMTGTVYSGAFLLTMVLFGDVRSPWAVLALPAAMLLAVAFAAVGLAATTYMRSFIDFDFVQLATIPMFLFSGVFFPLSRYPDGLELLVRCTPLVQGVELVRAATLGRWSWAVPVQVAYLVVMALVGVRVAGRRLRVLLGP